ncbi:MAG: uroporphyrinogen decarboxylase family protein [Anaerolineales bacterium]|jgi:uroporphyrinogen decarboxylase
MNTRERFHAVMGFEPGVRTLRWEFGYWNATVDRWYTEGLKRSPYSPPPGLADGGAHYGEGLPFPYNLGTFRYRDHDIHTLLKMDPGTASIPLNWRFSPPLREAIIEEDETTQLMINADGVTVRVRKDSASIPQFVDWPVRDWTTWRQVKEERFGLEIMTRFPARWHEVAASYRQRDYPLGLRMEGFFSIPRELMGIEHQLLTYYDDPKLMHDINETLATVWLAMLEEVLSRVDLDFVHIWEDMAFKNGPLISPLMFKTFLSPYYRRITEFLKMYNIDHIFVDTDGNCWELIEPFLNAGVRGLFPFEVQAGMDVVEVRQRFPQLLIQGGLDKVKVAQGKAAIDAELEAKLPFMLSHGGYIPFLDHLVPPDVSWDNFLHYRERVNQYIESYPSQLSKGTRK